jgi:hypothetical protein
MGEEGEGGTDADADADTYAQKYQVPSPRLTSEANARIDAVRRGPTNIRVELELELELCSWS